ncbi:MAG TPA: PTS IIA-like nitrogen-regulatory protein PtsN [Thiotrichales bacterium]|nr:PTS IIA-like nitrogen-regulatory protein PtsN [Thiotrichales bacterium]
MDISQLIDIDRVAHDFHASSKKRSLEEVSQLLASGAPDLSAEAIFDSLIGRERLGSTGLGHGVAIPHGRLTGQEKTVGAFLRLDEAIDFDALDGQPVDLLFALLVPEHATDEHLEMLAQVAEMFANREFVKRLREASDARQLFELLTHWHP